MWLAGGPAPEGEGRIPNITPGGAVADWSEDDLVNYFETGFTPEFDSVGGSMVEVQRNLARLPKDDLQAIAAYLKMPLTRCQVRRFADMEVFVEIQENVRGADTFIIQSTSFPANERAIVAAAMFAPVSSDA